MYTYEALASGMISSATTYIMAPAAKASAYGSMGCAAATATAPRTPNTGSTMPESWPYLMANKEK